MIMENDKELMTEEEKQIQWIKKNNKWAHKVFIAIDLIVMLIVGIIGLCVGKVVEENLFQEVTKWIVGGLGVGIIFCVFLYYPVELMKLARIEYYPKYGKSWFKKAFRMHILGKKD